MWTLEVIGPQDAFAPPSAVLISADDSEMILSADEFHSNQQQLQELCADVSRIILLSDAKYTCGKLRNLNFDIARPICLKTLATLVAHEGFNPGHAQTLQDAITNINQSRNLFAELFSKVEKLGLNQVARIECLLTRVFADIEHRGLFINRDQWAKHISEAEARMKSSAASARELLGEEGLNLDHSVELKKVLEQKLGQTIASTAQGTLKEINHPAALAIIGYRESAKLVQTYGDGFLGHIHPRTGRIHASFEPLGTSTGRLSCHGPNLQNLPSGKAFHECVQAPPGRSLITADYAGFELRILASLSGDEVFLRAFEQDVDLHAKVASELFGVEVSQTKNTHLRQRAKAINFGLVYGMGEKALARQINLSIDEAANLLRKYFETYPGIRRYLDRSVDKALSDGYAQTVLGRKLYFDPNILASNNARGELSRIAKNMPIQGSGADILKLAMLKLHERLSNNFKDAGMVNTIHDEIVVECQQDNAYAVAQIVKEEMEGAQKALTPNVAPKVTLHIGQHWTH